MPYRHFCVNNHCLSMRMKQEVSNTMAMVLRLSEGGGWKKMNFWFMFLKYFLRHMVLTT